MPADDADSLSSYDLCVHARHICVENSREFWRQMSSFSRLLVAVRDANDFKKGGHVESGTGNAQPEAWDGCAKP
jgi:hypothetical protein